MRFIKTTGDRGVDNELEGLHARLTRLEGLAGAKTSNSQPAQTVTLSGASGVIVQQSDGTNQTQATVIQADLSAGFAVTSASPVATLTRTANSITPIVDSGAGAAGSSIIAANQDHVHPVSGVTSLAVSGALIAKSGATGTVTLTVSVPLLASDPGAPVAGDLWFNTTTSLLSLFTGAATKRVAMA